MGEKLMSTSNSSASIRRREFVARLLSACPQSLVIAGLGSSAYDLFAAGDRHENFYLWGAMGGAAVMGLGLAIAQPTRSVLVITGDGEQLMGLGALATVGSQQPANLSIVVLDNGHFGETGMQASHTSLGTQLAEVARSCGIADSTRIHALDEVDALAARVNARSACLFAQVHVLDEELPLWVPIPALAEIQIALQEAVADVTQLEGYELKRIMRTGTVATIDNRNWELRDQSGPVRRLSQSRAIALDMESATIAANGFRFRVPYGTLLCVSDKPLHGELKLPGMATDFYKTQVSRHLQIGIRAMERLRQMPIGRIHSRKLRSFEETAFL
jgi:hypothetical protein